jgi:predicted transcriptional regulator
MAAVTDPRKLEDLLLRLLTWLPALALAAALAVGVASALRTASALFGAHP